MLFTVTMNRKDDSDCEEITEWPPREQEISPSSDESSEEDILQDERRTQNIRTTRQASLPDVGPDQKRAKFCDVDEDSCEEGTQTALVALARWWRREGRNTITEDSLPESSNPNTRLLHVAKTEKAQMLLKSETIRLKDKVRSSNGLRKAALLSALATFYDITEQYKEAETCLYQSLHLNPSSKNTQWLLAKVKKQLDAINVQMETAKTLEDKKKEGLSFPKSTPVEKVSGNSLSAEEFFKRYSVTSTPVVITDVVKDMTTSPWSIEYVRKTIGHKQAPVKLVVSGSAEWAQLETAKTMKVSDFIDSLDEPNAQPLYLFDWSLPLHCPELSKELTIPKYFCHDFLKKTREGSLYKDSWPSLFVAPKDLAGGLHVDAFGSNFWMALFEGRKRWLFFQKEDLPFLYPRYSHSMDPTFEADVFRPDLVKFPLLSQTHPRECVLQAGELLFVPAGCPHRVENLDKSLAVSGNFVDESNLKLVKEELRINSLKDLRSLDLLQQFKDTDVIRAPCHQ